MSDMLTRPRGLFDRATVGLVTEPVEVRVEAGRISFFAETLGENDPVHHDRKAARAAGFPEIPAPPTFAMVIDLEAGRIARRLGRQSVFDRIGCDYTRLLHGEERYDYSGTILAGDRVTIETEVIGFEDKKGGALEIAHLRATIRHPERGVLVTISRALVHRLT